MNKIYQKSFLPGKTAGFTLIELLVVVLIIGILAAVAVPQYQKAVARARAIEGRINLLAIARAQVMHMMATGDYANEWTELDVKITPTPTTSYLCARHPIGGYMDCIANIPANHMKFVFSIDKSGLIGQRCVANPNDDIAVSICKSLGKFRWSDVSGDYYELVD